MLKRIILSTIGLGVLAIAAAVTPRYSDPIPDCFPFDCSAPPCTNCAR